MKYKRGSIVEVFCYQSWRCARIVSSKGHDYTVSYDVYPGFTSKDDVEHISVESIRPCPPLLQVSECWVPGDVAEVFYNLSWKMVIVLKDFGLDQFLVRLVGSLQEFEVMKSELRVRQSYQNGEWAVISKVTRDYKDANYIKFLKYDQDSDSQAKKKYSNGDFYTKDLCFDTQNNHHLMESRTVPSKTLKRASPWCYSQGDETNKKRAQRLRIDENKDSCRIDSYGYESSSGSCSINSYNKPYGIYHGRGFVKDVEDHESDAESVCQFGYDEESQSQSQSQETDEIHRLELRGYSYTMAALHASGPLSWEKETMGQSSDLSPCFCINKI